MSGRTAFTIAYVCSRPARIAYLVLTLAVAIASWLGLTAMLSPFLRSTSPDAANVSVGNARTGAPMPVRYAAQIALMPGVTSLTYDNYLPVICKQPTVVATLNGGGGSGVLEQLARYGITPQEAKAWQADLRGILVGATLARNCGWISGLGVQPPDMNERPIDLHIIGVFHSDEPYAEQIAIAHFDYLDRLADPAQRGQMFTASVRATDPADAPSLAARIDATFSHSAPPTHSAPNGTAENGLSRFGKVQALIAWVIGAIFVCAALVFTSVMAHSAAERRASFAILRALGFKRRFLFSLFAWEAAAVIIASGVLGIAVGLIAIHLLAPSVSMVLGGFWPPPWAFAWLPILLIAWFALGMVFPLRAALTTRPTDYQTS